MSDELLHKIFDTYKENNDLILWKNVKMILNIMNIDLDNVPLIPNNTPHDFNKFKSILNDILLKNTHKISYKILLQTLCAKYGDDIASYIMTTTYGSEDDMLVDPTLILTCLEDIFLSVNKNI